jgi:quercetin dioxygenase-like cupin family protein
MTSKRRTSGVVRRTLLATGALVAISTSALAGECPADKVVADGKGHKPSAEAARGVADKVIGSINLANEAPRLANRKFRLRRLAIQPGGVVPWHSHDERPAIIYIVSGTIVEYRSTCSVPIEHHAGDVAQEAHGTSHWWKNTTRKPVILLSADILHEKADPKAM